MILPIYVYGQPVLRKVAEDIAPDYPNLKELIENMFETMDNAEGVGLAAPQIGLPIRVVTINLDVLSDDLPEYKDFRKAYINAHILEVSGEEVSMDEGCLSLPGIHESVKRGNKIRVQYLDENLEPHDEIIEGYLARVMQHEFDHLEGKMFIDHLSPLRKQMIKGKLNAMLKGKAHCTYKVKTGKKSARRRKDFTKPRCSEPRTGFTDARGAARFRAKSRGFGKSIPLAYEEGIDRRVSSGFQENRILHHTAKQVFGKRNPLRCFHNEKTGGFYEHQK